MWNRNVAVLVGLAATCAPATARADEKGALRAETLFSEARKLMNAHDYAAACPRFAQSWEIDPAPGTALNLAVCYEKAGKLATAWATFETARAAAETAGQKNRAAAARAAAAALESKLSRLTIEVPEQARVTGLEVRCDGDAVSSLEWGTAAPRDGGAHEVTASAPGKLPWHTRVELNNSGDRSVVEVPRLEDAPAAPAPAAEVPRPTPVTPALSASRENAGTSTANPGQTRRIVGLATAGAGVLALGAGGVLGLVAKQQFNTATGESQPTADTDSRRAVSTANVATGFVIGGAVVAAVGVTIWLSAPSASVTVGATGSGVLVSGRF